jgi:hypothetical protein
MGSADVWLWIFLHSNQASADEGIIAKSEEMVKSLEQIVDLLDMILRKSKQIKFTKRGPDRDSIVGRNICFRHQSSK